MFQRVGKHTFDFLGILNNIVIIFEAQCTFIKALFVTPDIPL